MSEPDRPDTPTPQAEPPAAPSPFDRPPEAGGGGRGTGPGVGKPLLIGCAGLLALLLIAGVMFVAKENSIFGWFLEAVQGEIQPLVPNDLPKAERDRLDRAFARAIEATRAGEADPFALQRVMQRIQSGVSAAAERGEKAKLSPADVEGITKALEAVPRSATSPGTSPEAKPPAPAPRAAPPESAPQPGSPSGPVPVSSV
jgi:hypothetical protein